MSKVDRLFETLLILQIKKRTITSQELSEKLDVSIKTIGRYIHALTTAGVPIRSIPGMGYELSEGYFLPPIMFNEEEAVALMIGSKFVIKKVDASYRKDVKSAVDKIKGMLKKDTLEYINKIDESTLVMDDKFTDKSFTAKIHKAIADSHIIKLKYYSLKGELTEREIEPMDLVYYNDDWRIIAFCKLRNDFREFRFDRINNIKYTTKKFVKRKFNLKEFVGDLFKIYNPTELKVLFNRTSAQIVKEKYPTGFISEKNVKNSVEMTFIIDERRIDITLNWILTFHKHAKIISPQALRTRLKQKAEDILKLY